MYGHVTGCSKLVSFPGTFESEAAASCRTNVGLTLHSERTWRDYMNYFTNKYMDKIDEQLHKKFKPQGERKDSKTDSFKSLCN